MADTTLRHVLMEPGTRERSLPVTTDTGDNKGSAFNLPRQIGGVARSVTWEITVVGVPSALACQLEGAMTDTEAEFTVLDSATGTASYARTFTPCNYNFIRVRQTARTGGTSVAADITCS